MSDQCYQLKRVRNLPDYFFLREIRDGEPVEKPILIQSAKLAAKCDDLEQQNFQQELLAREE